jgi:hypothetical protein
LYGAGSAEGHLEGVKKLISVLELLYSLPQRLSSRLHVSYFAIRVSGLRLRAEGVGSKE